jgi:phosphoribosyl-ATP pyrophosphohydrolase
MTDAVKLSDLKYPDLCGDGSRRNETRRHGGGPRQTRAVRVRASASSPRETESPVAPGELDRLHRSLAEVTPENHPRTARLLASSSRKTAQKVIEEAGEVALEAVKHRARGIVRESADLFYNLVALWHRAGIDPADVWRRCAPAPTHSALPKSCPKHAATIVVVRSGMSSDRPKLNRNRP